MTTVSSIHTDAVRPLRPAEQTLGAQKAQRPDEERRPLKPVMDEYVPEEPREPSGRYWMGRDASGQPRIYFDDPERAADAPETPGKAPDAKKPDAPEAPRRDGGPKGPEQKAPKEETWVCDTGKVDRELEQLKKKQQELAQRLSTEPDEARRKELERQLARAEQELGEKDNDAYRKRHSTFTQLS